MMVIKKNCLKVIRFVEKSKIKAQIYLKRRLKLFNKRNIWINIGVDTIIYP